MSVSTQEHSPITLGEVLKKAEIGGFVLTQTYHPPHFVLPRHSHEWANINLTLNGSFRETMGNRVSEVLPSNLLVKPAGESHANRYGNAGAHCLIIEVRPYYLETIRRHSRLFDTPAHIRRGSLPALVVRIYKEFEARLNASELMIEGLILEMLAETSRQNAHALSSALPPRRVREVRDIIHESFADGLSLSTLAATVDVNPTYLARTFRKFYGCSVGEYVRRIQLEFAARQLIESTRPLAEIATSAGFYDQSHFTNSFKRYTRVAPAEFRATAQKQKG